VPAELFLHTGEKTAIEQEEGAKATHAFPLPLKRRGLWRAKARFCQ
jgi:hypothetical protein